MLSMLKTAAVAGAVTLSALLAVPVTCLIVLAMTAGANDGMRPHWRLVGINQAACSGSSNVCVMPLPDHPAGYHRLLVVGD